MAYATGVGCVRHKWNLDRAITNGRNGAQIQACGSLDNVESYKVVSNSSSYSKGKFTCVDVTLEVKCINPVFKDWNVITE